MQFSQEPNFVEATLKLPGGQSVETLETVKRLISDEKPDSFDDCVAWARLSFQELFYNQVRFCCFQFYL